MACQNDLGKYLNDLCKDKYSIVYLKDGKLIYVSSKACGGTQDRIEWKTQATALKWLREFRSINYGTPFGDKVVPFLTKNDVIIDPEVTAVGGNMLKGFTLYFYNTTLVLDKAETLKVREAFNLHDCVSQFIGLNYFKVLDAIERK